MIEQRGGYSLFEEGATLGMGSVHGPPTCGKSSVAEHTAGALVSLVHPAPDMGLVLGVAMLGSQTRECRERPLTVRVKPTAVGRGGRR